MTALFRRRLLLPALLAGAALAALPLLHHPERAAAHPLGNFTVNRYSRIELAPTEVRLRYVLDLAEIPAFQEKESIDADGDGEVSAAENSAYAASKAAALREHLTLTIDGKPVELRATASDLSFPPGQGGLSTLRLVADFAAPVAQSTSARQVAFSDGNYGERIGWREIVVRPLAGVRVAGAGVPLQDVSDELRAYPEGGLSEPLDVSSVDFTFEEDATAAGQPVAPPSAASTNDAAVRGNSDSPLARYADLIGRDSLGPGVVLVALIAAVGFGALHALSPGHGKTVVAAYLVGSRGTARHALLLGLTVTATHTSSVYALGFVTLYLSDFILPEDLYPLLGVASGGLILAMGLSLLVARLRAAQLLPDVRRWVARGVSLASAEAGRVAVPAARAGGHVHAESDAHRHGPFGRAHSHPAHSDSDEPVSWRSLIGLGIFGGMLPCPSAIVVMLSAIALHRVAFGLLLIVAFSAGLAAVLTGIGLFLVYAGRVADRMPIVRALLQHGERGGLVSFAMRAFPVGSAAVIAAAGLVITLRALADQGLI
jgi:ABC-type nickel/cobalt efflux system permease component RcnA